jgi:hypothetical protein
MKGHREGWASFTWPDISMTTAFSTAFRTASTHLATEVFAGRCRRSLSPSNEFFISVEKMYLGVGIDIDMAEMVMIVMA